MAVITQTVRNAGVQELVRTILTSGSDTLTYVANSNQMLEIHNNTAAALDVTIKGTAPPAALVVPGTGGTTLNLSTGKIVNVGINKTMAINLDSISAYLAGTGAVTVAGGAACIATLTAG